MINLSGLVTLFNDNRKQLNERAKTEPDLDAAKIALCLSYLVDGYMSGYQAIYGKDHPIIVDNAPVSDRENFCRFVWNESKQGRICSMNINFVEYACGKSLGFGDYQE